MKSLNRNLLILLLAAASSEAFAMEGAYQTAPSLVASIETGLYGPPETVNFNQIKQYINQLNPNDPELNQYDHFIDGTALDLAEDRKRDFGDGYEDQYNEIIALLKAKGAQNSLQRKYSAERPTQKL